MYLPAGAPTSGASTPTVQSISATSAQTAQPASATSGAAYVRSHWTDDAWIAIACETQTQWQGLVTVMGAPAWSVEPIYAQLHDRMAHQDELERHLADWTRPLDGTALQRRLLEAGVPCGVALKTLDLFEDPQLVHRQHFVPLEHPEMGTWKYDALAFKLPDAPSKLRRAAPLLGEHTQQVLKEFLGYTDTEYAALSEAGVLQ